jgi:hypothetical protein
MKNSPILVLFLFFYSCATNIVTITNKEWLVHVSKNHQDQDTVKITLTNIHNESLTVFDPFQKNIEKYDADTWNKIPVLYCICGNCAPPPELLTLASKENFVFSWDKNVEKCMSGKVQKEKMTSGRYRVVIKYAKTPLARSLEKLIVEFQL